MTLAQVQLYIKYSTVRPTHISVARWSAMVQQASR